MSDDEHDPTAEHGPDDCDPDPDTLEVDPGEGEGGPDAAEWHPADETHDAFPIESLATPFAADGLPDHGIETDHQQAEAPAFTCENLCCIEDKREYVELFREELSGRAGWQPVYHVNDDDDDDAAEVGDVPVHAPGSALDYFVLQPRYDGDGLPRRRHSFPPERVVERWGQPFVEIFVGPPPTATPNKVMPVRPRRERCIHYKRQEHPFQGDRSHREVKRNCTHPARRSVAGAAMSLQNESMYGCDYREPFDAASVASMDKFDDDKIQNKPHLIRLPMFGIGGDAVRVPEEHKPS